ncbi:MAG: glycosyltransferase [Fidelibacterota bacterium]|jgi:dolichyl-phosphate beta-glucosyltransferase|tara:strand:- start:129 stop:863 length:735 start_codon:yes stop_codon:yes gene_type:complete
MKVVIIIPCYNEADRLDENKFIDYLSQNAHLHFIFVDDGSTDNTSRIINQIILKCNSLVSFLKNETNKGKAESVRLGVIESYKMNPDYIGFLDADLATPIGEIDNLLKIIYNDKTKEVVFASRIQLIGSEIKRNYFRHFIGRLFATCVSLFLKIRIYDTQCGAKIFSRKICDDIFYEQFISPWLFDVELFARLLNVYGMEKTIQMSYENPVSKWIDIDGSKVKPLFFLKAPFELFKIVRHYKLK